VRQELGLVDLIFGSGGFDRSAVFFPKTIDFQKGIGARR
jgi:hypothetical protein